jgi:outer membrane protein assembly factor BamB
MTTSYSGMHQPSQRSLTLLLLVSCAALVRAEQSWPAFRGPSATGLGGDTTVPAKWDVESGRNVAWKRDIPGLGHSSPIVSGDRVFVTTAMPLDTPAGPSDSAARHAWKLYCLDRATGRIVWERTAHEGVPRVKRHPKASHASATPATDGQHVVASMGSEGLFAYDMNGTLLWKQDLGRLNVGLASDPREEWGPASSPVIHEGRVIVQNDRPQDSYLAAFDIRTGKEVWRVGRTEKPSWATPLVHPAAVIVTNSPFFIRGHDLRTGRELWRVADHTGPGAEGEVKVVTPLPAGDKVIVTGGYPSGARPIFAIRAASGEVAWKLDRGSPYTPTPLVHDGTLYVVGDNGVLSAYVAETGERLYQHRLADDAGGFSASPVAAGGRLYFASEDGDVFVVRAGKQFELLARNDMREMCLATPAVAGAMLFVRTRGHVYALKDTAAGGD